jgi:hypothetical protein
VDPGRWILGGARRHDPDVANQDEGGSGERVKVLIVDETPRAKRYPATSVTLEIDGVSYDGFARVDAPPPVDVVTIGPVSTRVDTRGTFTILDLELAADPGAVRAKVDDAQRWLEQRLRERLVGLSSALDDMSVATARSAAVLERIGDLMRVSPPCAGAWRPTSGRHRVELILIIAALGRA